MARKMSDSVMSPTSVGCGLTTGNAPILRSRMMRAADSIGASGVVTSGSRAMRSAA